MTSSKVRSLVHNVYNVYMSCTTVQCIALTCHVTETFLRKTCHHHDDTLCVGGNRFSKTDLTGVCGLVSVGVCGLCCGLAQIDRTSTVPYIMWYRKQHTQQSGWQRMKKHSFNNAFHSCPSRLLAICLKAPFYWVHLATQYNKIQANIAKLRFSRDARHRNPCFFDATTQSERRTIGFAHTLPYEYSEIWR